MYEVIPLSLEKPQDTTTRYNTKDTSMNRLIATLGLLFLITSVAYGSEIPANHIETVESYLKGLEVELQASEYAKARSYITGDLNDDGTEDLAVQYTLEGIGGGGNNYSFFLAVFIKSDDGLRFLSDSKVGGKFSRTLEFVSVSQGLMTFATSFRTIRPDGNWDASCCPSGIGKAYYVLVKDSLVELNSAEAVPVDFTRLMKRRRR